MTSRASRLGKLLEVQRQMKALHETRRAGLLAEAVRAEQEAADIAARLDGGDAMATMFPELYHRRIDAALRLAGERKQAAQDEAQKVSAATLREKRIAQAHREAAGWEERLREERQRLDTITLGLAGQKASRRP
ncbi:MAG: hypothetical protein ABTQ31_06500 [Rhizobiaceae bacterium]